jgi:hypothetical protein
MQFLKQMFFREDIERPKGLVHQKHFGIGGIASRQIDTLLHASEQLTRPRVAEFREAD